MKTELRMKTKHSWFVALLITVFLAFSVVACGDDNDDKNDEQNNSAGTGSQKDNTGSGEFGDTCKVNGDCDSDVCEEFGQLGLVCTQKCNDDGESCPEGSEGKKCNKSGFCRP